MKSLPTPPLCLLSALFASVAVLCASLSRHAGVEERHRALFLRLEDSLAASA